MRPSYIGTSIENKPVRLMSVESLHKAYYLKATKSPIPTIQQTIQCLDYWLNNYFNSKPCVHFEDLSIKEVLNTVQKADCEQRTTDENGEFSSADSFNANNQAKPIDKNILNNLMMKSEIKTIHRNGIRFLNNNYYNEALFGLREQVYIRYSLFDLSKIHVYSIKGEFICAANQVTKIHPMANHLGTVRDMEDFKQKIQKHLILLLNFG